MKHILAVIGESILMLIAGVAFMFWRPLHITHVLWQTATQRRVFEADWIVGVIAVAVVIVLVEALRKRFRRGVPQLVIAIVIVLIVGFLFKLGFRTSTYFPGAF